MARCAACGRKHDQPEELCDHCQKLVDQFGSRSKSRICRALMARADEVAVLAYLTEQKGIRCAPTIKRAARLLDEAYGAAYKQCCYPTAPS